MHKCTHTHIQTRTHAHTHAHTHTHPHTNAHAHTRNAGTFEEVKTEQAEEVEVVGILVWPAQAWATQKTQTQIRI